MWATVRPLLSASPHWLKPAGKGRQKLLRGRRCVRSGLRGATARSRLEEARALMRRGRLSSRFCLPDPTCRIALVSGRTLRLRAPQSRPQRQPGATCRSFQGALPLSRAPVQFQIPRLASVLVLLSAVTLAARPRFQVSRRNRFRCASSPRHTLAHPILRSASSQKGINHPQHYLIWPLALQRDFDAPLDQ